VCFTCHPCLHVSHAPHFAGQANLPHKRRRRADFHAGQGRHHGDDDGEVGGGFDDAQATDDVQIHVAAPQREFETFLDDRAEQQQPLDGETVGRTAGVDFGPAGGGAGRGGSDEPLYLWMRT